MKQKREEGREDSGEEEMTSALWAGIPAGRASLAPLQSHTLGSPMPTPCLASEAPMTAESGERALLQTLRRKTLHTSTCWGRSLLCCSVVASSPHL